MKYKRRREIDIEIARLRHISPPDDLIQTYADFKKHRNALPFYKYNPVVFQALIDLIVQLWDSEERINRMSLLFTAKNYLERAPSKLGIEETTATKIFQLFRKIILEDAYPSESEDMRFRASSIINGLMKGIALSEEQVYELCTHYDHSDNVLNRILRHPVRSALISAWARKHYSAVFAIDRRAEVASWVIDEDPDFCISEKDYRRDLQSMLNRDKQIFHTFFEKLKAYQEFKKQLIVKYGASKLPATVKTTEEKLKEQHFPGRPVLKVRHSDKTSPWHPHSAFPFYFSPPFDEMPMEKELEAFILADGYFDRELLLRLPRRPYRYVYKTRLMKFDQILRRHIHREIYLPNFTATEREIEKNYHLIYNRTMLWSITYSRLDVKKKVQRISAHYHPENYYTLFRIGKRLQSIAYYRWLKAML